MSVIKISKLILRFLPLILILCHTGNVYASGGKIVGKVTDADTGEPIPGVNIIVTDRQIGAATDIEGDYFILNVPPGTYSLKASMVGYQTVTMTEVEVSLNHTTEINFKLQPTVLAVDEEVMVVAKRPPVERDETSTRHYVDAKEISTRPATQLSHVLTTLPGIDQDAAGELTVRRGSLDQVAFIIDGIRARNPLDFEPYTNINLTSIQELEVITGGFNAEYGEARSGVFNIITKDGGDKLNLYSEFRYMPSQQRHWGTAFYDYSTDRYWENTHARHLEWWIDNPDMWVDPNGVSGDDPASVWTPQQAYQNYMDTHQPLTDYTNQSGYMGEMSLGGPTPINNMYFFVSGKYRSEPPVTGNSYRDRGTWLDATAKITYKMGKDYKLMFSGFYGEENSEPGMEYLNTGWIQGHGLENKYAYYDFNGYPESYIHGETVQFTHVLSASTFYQIQGSHIYRFRSQSTFPGDEEGWETGVPEYDRLRALDRFGNPIPGGYNNLIGLHTTGYYYRGTDKNTDLTLSADLTSQINKSWEFKTGGDFTYYILDRYQEAKAFEAIEEETYHPYEGNVYFQSKLEFEGLIINAGLRFDYYNPNDRKYVNIYDPFDIYRALQEGREPNPETVETSTFGQLSPRIGISHPISENTVLHFSYGHFFQRASFGNYGEGTGGDADDQQVTGILNTYLAYAGDYPAPYNLGNRELKPRKTVAYELGIEHNIGGIVADVTAYYKDYTNTVRPITVFTLSGGRYLTTGNGNYGDAKGIEVAVRKPLSNLWGGYLNYSWSTGIYGRSGDATVLAPPNSDIQIGETQDIGDALVYDPSRLKFGLTLITPSSLSFLGGIFADVQFAIDYQVYFPHDRIASDVFSEGGYQYIRPADKNADLRVRKEFDILGVKPAFFLEVRNVFNYKWVNLDVVKSASPEDRIRFINSGFDEFPETKTNGAPFPDVLMYRNLPRRVILGFALTL